MYITFNEWTEQITAQPNHTEQQELFRIYRHQLYYGGPMIIDETKFTVDHIEYFPSCAMKLLEVE